MTPRQVRADELQQAHDTLRAIIEGYEYERRQSADNPTIQRKADDGNVANQRIRQSETR